MTIRLLVAYQGLPIGARISRDLVFEKNMVAMNKASFDLTGSFQWPMESADEILGPFTTAAILEAAYPAAKYVGFTALVGAALPYAVYFSDGQVWVANVGSKSVAGIPDIVRISRLTQAQYDALGTKDDSTLYVIVG